jgi:hypothetical protein
MTDLVAADVDEKLLGFIESVHIYCQDAQLSIFINYHDENTQEIAPKNAIKDTVGNRHLGLQQVFRSF